METYYCRRHWSVFIPYFIVAIIFAILGFGGLSDVKTNGKAILFCLGMVALVLVAGFISYRATYLSIQNGMVVGRVGVLHSKTLSAPLARIQNVSVSSGIMGKILGYQTVVIATAAGILPQYEFHKMANGYEFVEALNNALPK